MKIQSKRRPYWLIALVAAVALGLIALNRPLPEYLVASADLASGTRIELSQLEVSRLALGDAGGQYLGPTELREGSLLTRPVLRGELLPRSALSDYANPNFTQLVLRPSTLPATSVTVGNTVAVWSAASRDGVSQPRLLVGRAEVTAIISPEGLFSDALPSVQLLIPKTSIAVVVQALALKHEIYLVPVS